MFEVIAQRWKFNRGAHRGLVDFGIGVGILEGKSAGLTKYSDRDKRRRIKTLLVLSEGDHQPCLYPSLKLDDDGVIERELQLQ